MAVSRAVHALRRMRELIETGSIDDLHDASAWALIFLAESVATQVGQEYRARLDAEETAEEMGNPAS